MATRTVERVHEELLSARMAGVAVVELYGSRNVIPVDFKPDSDTHAGNGSNSRMGTDARGGVGAMGCGTRGVGIEQQRETHGDVAVELAMALAEEFWCRTCGTSVGKGVQVGNHRRMGHVVTL